LLPCFHIFGSEELSQQAPGIAELIPRPYIALNTTDGALLGLKSGEPGKMTIGNSAQEIMIALRPDVPRGVALVSIGTTPMNDFFLSARGKFTPSSIAAYGVVKR
jgi:NADH-quinone oxidoreductase subunit G